MLKLLWDQSPADKDVFVAFDGSDALHTFLVNPDGNEGISCVKLGQTKVGAGQVPALLLSGEVTLQTSGGKLVKMTLSTHEISPNISGAHFLHSIHALWFDWDSSISTIEFWELLLCPFVCLSVCANWENMKNFSRFSI